MILGIALALLAGVSLGCITSFASLSYNHGIEPLSLILLRGLVATLVMIGASRVLGEPIFQDRRGMGFALRQGIALSMVGFGYMSAVAYISPGLAVAILYLFPMLVLVADSLRIKAIPPLMTIIAFSIALAGIITCVGVGGPIAPEGIMLALLASLGMAAFLLISADASRHGYGGGIAVWGNIIIILISGLAILWRYFSADVAISLPEDSIGLTATIAASLLYALGVMFSVLAVRHAPASLVALVMNIEPIITLLAARVLVEEHLTSIQYFGMVAAVAGIMLGSWAYSGNKSTLPHISGNQT
ncbi:EamA family transporter [Alphaproteobacteria bacterium LSUCC0684]